MNIALRRPMTLKEFLAWEERQELRHEFDGLAPKAMTGGTRAHSTIQSNLLAALNVRLRGKPCQAHGSHLKIEVAGRIRYPDAFVVCSPGSNASQVVSDPVVVFEILSPTSAHEDLVVKNAEYRATPSVRRYVVVEQGRIGALAFVRKDKDWVTEIFDGKDAVLALPEIGISVPMADLYADLVLPAEDSAAEDSAAEAEA
jgi:Uma2 family endonuclease